MTLSPLELFFIFTTKTKHVSSAPMSIVTVHLHKKITVSHKIIKIYREGFSFICYSKQIKSLNRQDYLKEPN